MIGDVSSIMLSGLSDMLRYILLVGLSMTEWAIAQSVVNDPPNPFKPLFEWQKVDWKFPNDTIKKAYEASGDYTPAHSVPLGVNIWQDKLFITVPRWKKGVPANLNYINLTEALANSKLKRF